MFIEDKWFLNLDNSKIRCNICSNYCKIFKNKLGTCKQYENIDNKLFSKSFSRISSYNVDSIEKKPLYHFLPGSLTYSIGGFGCNMSCLYCQNYMIAHEFERIMGHVKINSEVIVKNAIENNCKSISWTYNEPTIHLPFIEKTFNLSHEKNLKIIFVSNGFMSEESLDVIIDNVDAFNIDLKSMSNNFYKKLCKAKLEPVLENLIKIYNSGKHLEITNLLITDYNDSKDEIIKLVNFICENLSKKIPLHFSRAFPYYKMENIIPTSEKKLLEAKKIAEDRGMENVYIGNTPLAQNSKCPKCGEILIKRNSFQSENLNKIKNNKCTNCGEKLNFILK